MNIAKFVVLGTLDQYSPASGYDVIRELDKKMISRWTNVKKGSIYHALKILRRLMEQQLPFLLQPKVLVENHEGHLS